MTTTIEWTEAARVSGAIEAADLFGEFHAPPPNLLGEMSSRCSASVYGKGDNQFRLRSLRDHVAVHALAQQLRPRSRDVRTPLWLKAGASPRCGSAPHVGVVIQNHLCAAEGLAQPVDSRSVRHRPGNGRVVRPQAVRMRHVDAAVRVSEPSDVRDDGLVQERDGIWRALRLSLSLQALVALTVVPLFR